MNKMFLYLKICDPSKLYKHGYMIAWFYKIIFLLQENFWAIGTSPGATDVQDFTSIGQNVAGINNKLGGILQHDQTYYASFICTNGAGSNTTYIDSQGMYVCLCLEIVLNIGTG